ncbi:MAG: MATE family efflux transporter [Spirochaetes bacterium]|uniref:Multidrug export protein MepA n=1 Tax=Candidatus Ornithospirochaeta stercoripullorum TaxID=2840899 RepID=A0A9D9DYY9_9SPIO|nr:MATE family efflux transporter [Candidatus Ornithospirochaeta stercoripullorum]
MKIHQADFSEGKVSALILRVSFPLIIAELVNLLYNMVDRIYIGHLAENGSVALTGLGLCFPVISLISAFAKLFGPNGGAPLCAMERGKGDYKEASLVMGNSFTLSVGTGLILMFIVLVFNRPILYAFGASDITYPYARDYLMIYSLGTVPVLVTLSMNAFINSQGFAMIGMVTVLIGAGINIVLDPILIFTCSLGVKGAAIATVFSQTVSCIFAVWFLCGKNVQLKLNFRDMKLGATRCKRIIALGTSGFTMGATNSVVQLVCNKCAFIWGGDLYVGVMTILNSVREVYNTVMNGIGSGASPVMSFNYGAKNGERTIKASNFTLVCTFTYSMVVWLIIIIFPHAMAMLFTHDEAMIEASVSALRIYFFGFFFMAFQTAGQQTFVALGKAKQAVFFSLFRKVIIVVPLTIVLPFFFGINGVVIAEPISNVIGGLAAYLSMRHMVMPELRAMDEERQKAT